MHTIVKIFAGVTASQNVLWPKCNRLILGSFCCIAKPGWNAPSWPSVPDDLLRLLRHSRKALALTIFVEVPDDADTGPTTSTTLHVFLLLRIHLSGNYRQHQLQDLERSPHFHIPALIVVVGNLPTSLVWVISVSSACTWGDPRQNITLQVVFHWNDNRKSDKIGNDTSWSCCFTSKQPGLCLRLRAYNMWILLLCSTKGLLRHMRVYFRRCFIVWRNINIILAKPRADVTAFQNTPFK